MQCTERVWGRSKTADLIRRFCKLSPESVAVHLNDQEVRKLDEAAVLVDEYVLTHFLIVAGLTIITA